MDMMMDPSAQLAESGAMSAYMPAAPLDLAIYGDIGESNPILAAAVANSELPSEPVFQRVGSLANIALTLSESGADRLYNIMSNVRFDDVELDFNDGINSMIELIKEAGEWKAETTAAAGVASAEVKALKAVADKMLQL